MDSLYSIFMLLASLFLVYFTICLFCYLAGIAKNLSYNRDIIFAYLKFYFIKILKFFKRKEPETEKDSETRKNTGISATDLATLALLSDGKNGRFFGHGCHFYGRGDGGYGRGDEKKED